MTKKSLKDFKKRQLEIMSRNMKRLRAERDLDQFELADLAGVSVALIRTIEQEKKVPRPENIAAIAEALGVLPEQITKDEKAESDVVTKVMNQIKDLMKPQVVRVEMPQNHTSTHLRGLIERLEQLDPVSDSVMLTQLSSALDSYLSLQHTARTPKKRTK